MKKKTLSSAFTLVEILAGLAIAGTLATVASVNFQKTLLSPTKLSACFDINMITKAQGDRKANNLPFYSSPSNVCASNSDDTPSINQNLKINITAKSGVKINCCSSSGLCNVYVEGDKVECSNNSSGSTTASDAQRAAVAQSTENTPEDKKSQIAPENTTQVLDQPKADTSPSTIDPGINNSNTAALTPSSPELASADTKGTDPKAPAGDTPGFIKCGRTRSCDPSHCCSQPPPKIPHPHCVQDFSSDPQDCGGCNIVCPSEKPICENSVCVSNLGDACGNAICKRNENCCSSLCKDLSNDANNCGSCGNVCPAGQKCKAGACGFCVNGLDCGVNEGCCNNHCIPLGTNENCLTCNDKCDTSNGYACTFSGCTSTACGKGGTVCKDSAQTCCNNTSCVNLQSDIHNCGSCGNYCGTNSSCCAGKCISSDSDPENCGGCGIQCSPSQACCSGSCVDTVNDNNNCGTCGHKCASTEACNLAVCQPSCGNHQACTSATPDCCSGNCTNVNSDSKNCGRCNLKCPSSQTCTNGQCTCGGQQCNSSSPTCCNNSCINTFSDHDNCGACGHACSGAETCCSGKCLNLQTDYLHCGSCTNYCKDSQTCTNGVCGCNGSSCASGENCCQNGCSNPQTDNNNCGRCGNACTGGSICCLGQCVDTQHASWACGRCGNACGMDQICCTGTCTDTGVQNCGGCGKTCSTGQTCCSGHICADLSSDKSNCGKCGKVCEAFEACCSGKCVTPNSGGDDSNNCGACGVKCPDDQECINGVCTPYDG